MNAVGRVLIVEDETMLRASLARGLARSLDLDVQEAGDVEQAVALLEREPPDIVVSDIDMPGRTGIELLGELGKRGLRIPVIFVSAYLQAYGPQLPKHANIEVLEKPVALEELRNAIRTKLMAMAAEDPFSISDFLQLAGMTHRSVVLDAQWPDGRRGSIVVHEGEVWTASFDDLSGVEAFSEVAWRGGARIRCHSLVGDPGPRTLEGTPEALLMNTAKDLDEQGHTPDFEGELERGVTALLAKDYDAAVRAFEAAHAIDPEHPQVNTNLRRLRELGYTKREP